jgi:hypothetical protein
MSSLSQFIGSSGKPTLVTALTSGSGTFTPLVSNSWCRITLVGGGGGGARGNTSGSFPNLGGGGGATAYMWRRVAGPVSYSVGAAGVGATANNTSGTGGSVTVFDGVQAAGGSGGLPNVSANNTPSGGIAIEGTASGAANGSGSMGVSGGAGGGYDSSLGSVIGGRGPGFPTVFVATTANLALWSTPAVTSPGAVVTNNGGAGGGCSVYGKGGNGGDGSASAGAVGANAAGYGGGGGGGGAGPTSGNGGNGSGGLILIEEFGA